MEKMMCSENEPLEPKITSIGKGKSSSKPPPFLGSTLILQGVGRNNF